MRTKKRKEKPLWSETTGRREPSRNWQNTDRCASACSQACCLVTLCARLRASGIIKYPFGDDSAFDATVSMETGSTELHNIQRSLPCVRRELCYDGHHGDRVDVPSLTHTHVLCAHTNASEVNTEIPTAHSVSLWSHEVFVTKPQGQRS